MNNDYYKFLKELDGERKYTIDNSEKITKAVDNYLHENIDKEDKVFKEYEEFLKEEDEKREREESWNFDSDEYDKFKNESEEFLNSDEYNEIQEETNEEEEREESWSFDNNDEYNEEKEKLKIQEEMNEEEREESWNFDNNDEYNEEEEKLKIQEEMNEEEREESWNFDNNDEYNEEEEKLKIQEEMNEEEEREESWNFDNEEDEYDDEDEYIKKELLTISKLFEECMNTKYIKALKSKCDKKQKRIEEKIEKYKEEGKVHKDILIESQQYMSMYEIFYAIKEIVLSSFQGDFFTVEGKSVEEIIDLSIKSLERLDEEFNVMDKEFNATLIEFLSRLEEEYIQCNNYEENYERIYEIETYELLKNLLNDILSKEEGYKRREKEKKKKKEEMSSEEMKIKEYSALLEKGYSYSKIAGEVGKSRQAVSNFCKKHNLSKKRKNN